MVTTAEPLGAVFAPVAGASRIVYQMGGGAVKTPMFQCPVSAIPAVVWDLLEDWRSCRLMRCLPVAGAWQDQPLLVRRAFPVFEAQMQAIERSQAGDASAAGIAAALKALTGR